MICSEEKDCVLFETGLFECCQQTAQAIIQRCAMGIITRHVALGLATACRRNIWRNFDFCRIVHRAIPLRRDLVRIMWRPPGEAEQEGFTGFGTIKEILLGVLRLRNCVVSVPNQFLRRIRIIKRMVIIVSAFEGLPILKALSAFLRDKVGTAISVKMPFAYVACIVPCGVKDRKSTRLNSSHIPLSRMPSS